MLESYKKADGMSNYYLWVWPLKLMVSKAGTRNHFLSAGEDPHREKTPLAFLGTPYTAHVSVKVCR